jgi:NAD+ kinase
MKTVALYVNTHRPRAHELAQTAVRIARDAGLAVVLADDLGDWRDLNTNGARLADADVIVTIGGDGTLLRAVQLAFPLDVPIFGVNTGRLGFLTEIDESDDVATLLAEVMRGRFHVEERLALAATVNGGESHIALNEVVVRRASNARMAPFGLAFDRVFSLHRRSNYLAASRSDRRRRALAAHVLRAPAHHARKRPYRHHL